MDTEPDTVRKPWIETPLVESATFSQLAGCRIFLKLELLQPSGSFKSRGIGNLILKSVTDPANAGKAIHFYSSSGGNAGLAAVRAARDLNCACTVVVPDSTKPLMISKLRNAGATGVLQRGQSWSEADTYLRENFIRNQDSGPETETVNVYVPPFDHPLIWEGAATMIDELARQLPSLEPGESNEGDFPADAILCSVGGGGLFNGVIEGLENHFNSAGARSGSSERKKVHVVAVETIGANSLTHSIASGRLTPLPAITSKATSLGALRVAEKTFRNAKSPPNGIKVNTVVGTDSEAAEGVVRLADEMRLQVELACGISLETAINGEMHRVVPHLTSQSRVVVIICGGSNINSEMIAKFRKWINMGWE